MSSKSTQIYFCFILCGLLCQRTDERESNMFYLNEHFEKTSIVLKRKLASSFHYAEKTFIFRSVYFKILQLIRTRNRSIPLRFAQFSWSQILISTSEGNGMCLCVGCNKAF